MAPEPCKRVAIFTDSHWDRLPTAIRDRWRHKPAVIAISVTADSSAATANSRDGTALILACPATLRDAHALLATFGPFDAIVDERESTERARLDRLRRSFFHLRVGGIFLSSVGTRQAGRAEAGRVAQFVNRMINARTQKGVESDLPEADLPFARAMNDAVIGPDFVEITNGDRAFAKLRYAEMDAVLSVREPALGFVHTRLPSVTWDSRAKVRSNRTEQVKKVPTHIKVPELGLRVYNDVVCAPHQVLMADHLMLPDSYRHYIRKMGNHWLVDVNEYFTQPKRPLGTPRPLSGEYYFLGSEYPQHFGHLMTEQVSRLWAWHEAKLAYPSLKALVSVRKNREKLARLEASVFVAAGIPAEDIVEVGTSVRVEKLLAPAPMFVNPNYVHPDIVKIWRRIGKNLRAPATDGATPEKLFISRKPHQSRQCRNGPEVEEIFRRHGFTVVFPEEYSLPEQVRMFDQARAIAGYAGSGLFTMAFCSEPKDVILIRTTSYGARNEDLIAAAQGHRFHLLCCDPEKNHPPGRWDKAAFHSGFTVDLERDGEFLRDVLSKL